MQRSTARGPFKAWQQRRTQAWLSRRIPASRELSLNRRNLFILPTGFGWATLAAIATLLLIGNNYQNNLIIGFGLWLVSLWLLSLILCHQNLSGTHLSLQQAGEGASDKPIRLIINVERKAQNLPYGLEAQLSQWEKAQTSEYQETQLGINLTLDQRGIWALPRISIKSVYPMGLFRCWTLADFQSTLVSYPAPLAGYPCPLNTRSGTQENTRNNDRAVLQDEFAGLQAYRSGERKSLLAWKQFAAGRGLQSKAFHGKLSDEIQLSAQALQHLPYEQALSILAFWCQQVEQQQHVFSMQLPHKHLSSGSGRKQLQQALRMLAEAPKHD